jgi:hypothetical protein
MNIHKRLKTDLKYLKHFRLITYENFCSSPQRCLNSIYDWLGLERNTSMKADVSNSNMAYYEAYEKMYNVVYNPLLARVCGGRPYPLWKRKLVNCIERKLLYALTNNNLMLVWKKRDIDWSIDGSSDDILQWGYDVNIPDASIASLADIFSVDQRHVIE